MTTKSYWFSPRQNGNNSHIYFFFPDNKIKELFLVGNATAAAIAVFVDVGHLDK